MSPAQIEQLKELMDWISKSSNAIHSEKPAIALDANEQAFMISVRMIEAEGEKAK